MREIENEIKNWVNTSLDKTIKQWDTGKPCGVEFDIDEFKQEIIEDVIDTHNIELSEDEMCDFESECENAIVIYLGKLMVEGLCNHIEGAHWMIYVGEK